MTRVNDADLMHIWHITSVAKDRVFAEVEGCNILSLVVLAKSELFNLLVEPLDRKVIFVEEATNDTFVFIK